MPTRNINLTDRSDGDASEVARDGLRLMERRRQAEQAKLKWLRGAAKEGIDSIDRGEGMEFASIDELDSHIDSIWNEPSGAVARKG